MKLNKILLISLILVIFISLSGVSATEVDNNSLVNDSNVDNLILDDNSTIDNAVLDSSNYDVSNNNYQITENSYSTYFDSNGNIITSSGIKDGDTLSFSGTISDKVFNINHILTLTSTNNALLYNCGINIVSGGSGSTISNLNINNTIERNPIVLYSSNNIVKDNTIFSQKAIGLIITNGANNNIINNNHIKTTGTELKDHSAIVVFGGNYNNITNNNIETEDANCIYFSNYGSGDFVGGYSFYNKIINNTITCTIMPTSWNYGIQLMGGDNEIVSNTITHTYRGISTSGKNNNKILNNTLINLCGKDYSTGELSGGDYGIVAYGNATVSGNKIINSTLISGIVTGEGSTITNNEIEVLSAAQGITVQSNNVDIENNIISTVTGSGISVEGNINHIALVNNTITSTSGIGIILKKQSSTKYPTYVSIVNNDINVGGYYAINAKETSNATFVISGNNVHGNNVLLPEGSSPITNNSTDFNGTVFAITNDNFYNYFYTNGGLITSIVKDGDILNFIGEFSNKNMVISSRVKLTGNNPIFKNSTIKVTSNGVFIENLTIINNVPNAIDQWGIYVNGGNNVTIINNNINVTDSQAAYGIYLLDSHGDKLINNSVYSSGDYLTYTILTYEVYESTIVNNTVFTLGTGQWHGFEAEACIDGEHNVPEIYRTYGILLLYSSNMNVSNNYVLVSSKLNNSPVNGSTNSIVGIDMYYNANDNVISSNNISLYGNDLYIYGTGVLGAQSGIGTSTSENNSFINNNIDITGSNVITGIITGYHSLNTLIDSNVINLNGANCAYGVTLEGSQFNTIKNNNIVSKSVINYLIELYSSNNNTINDNLLKGNGAYVYGLAGYKSSDNYIFKNTIIGIKDSTSSSSTNYNHSDVITKGNCGIYLITQSNNNTIENNDITTQGIYSVNSTTTTNIVRNNVLVSSKYVGDESVNPNNENVYNNTGKVVNYIISADNIVMFYKDGTKYVVTLTDGKYNPISGKTIAILINGKTYKRTTDSDGKAYLNINLAPNTYKLSSSFIDGNDNYNVNSTVLVKNIEPTLVTNNLTMNYKNGSKFTANLTNNGTPISGVYVRMVINGVSYFRMTDNNGIARLNINLKEGTYYITSSYSNSYSNTVNSSAFVNVISTGKKTALLITPDITMVAHDGTKFVATFTDSEGNYLVGKTVTLWANGVGYKRTIDSNGQASLNINLNHGVYGFGATFDGDSEYGASSSSAHISIQSGDGRTPVKLDSLKGSSVNQGSKFSVVLTDAGNNILANKNLVFNINGKDYTRTTDSMGIAGLTINLNPGTYVVRTAYRGDNVYDSSLDLVTKLVVV